MTAEHPKRRRWFQFKLRTLLIAILVFSLPLSWFAVRMEKARRQKEAVDAIKRLGGAVVYDWETVPPPIGQTIFQQKPYPTWLRCGLGGDFFDTVVWVFLERPSELQAPDPYPLPPSSVSLPAPTEPFMIRDDIGNDDLEVVTELKRVEILNLRGTHISDEGLENLFCLKYLKWLDLRDTQVTPEGVEKLQEALPNCQIEY